MDDVEEATFPDQTPEQSNFILLPSQDETQQESQVDKQMVKILKKLPALQNPDKKAQSETSDTCTDEENGKGKVAVLVSDTDSVMKTDANNGPSDVASDSDWEEEVTVVHRSSGARTVEETESEARKDSKSDGSHSSNGSSFQSRNRSNLGSYDQCEMYKTQDVHVKGDRFDPFPASQDMFEESGHDCASTPAEHIGSLHLSQKPMLVPETVDETVNEIPPSPGVYGSTPIIIPSSPTDDEVDPSLGNQTSELDDGNQTMFDINAAQTLSSQPKDDFHEEAVAEDHMADVQDKTDTQASKMAGNQSQADFRPDDGKSESAEFDINAAQTLSSQPKSVQPTKQKAQSVQGLKPPPSSQKLLGISESDVIVIGSASASVMSEKDVAEPEDFALHLSLSDTGTTQGHKSQAPDTKHSSESSQGIPGENLADKTGRKSSQRNPSQDDRTKDVRNQGSQESRSQGRGQSSGSDLRSQNRKKSKREKEIEQMNDNPLVEWRNESDTERREEMSVKSSYRFSDEFHLAVPKDVSVSDVAMETGDQAVGSQRTIVSRTNISQPQAAQEYHRESVPASGVDQDKLSIRMVQSQSENTEPVFKLQKPDLEQDEGILLEESEDVYLRTVPRSKPNARLIVEDSDEELPAHTGDTMKIAGSDMSTNSTHPDRQQQMFVATKLNPPEVEESSETTQSYRAEVRLQTDVNGNAEKDVALQQTTTPQKPTETSGGTAQAVRVRRLTESSTQTADGKVTDTLEVDVNVVQKVAEYLQAGYTPRSRSNSTCTDLSDLHGDGSEKGDNFMKTPHRKDRSDKLKTPSSLSRRESSDQRSPKSPHEIQNIIKTYSDILSKSKHKQKVESSSQKPNPSESDIDRKGKLVPRRLSSQSLPEDLGTKIPSVNTTAVGDAWISARKPLSQVLSVESDGKSDRASELNSPRKDVLVTTETGVTQELNESFRPENKPVDNDKLTDTAVNTYTEKLTAKQKLQTDSTGLDSETLVKDLENDENIPCTQRSVLTPSKGSDCSVNKSPFVPLERIDSKKNLSDSVTKRNRGEMDAPVGAENENFRHKTEVPATRANKQKAISLVPTETLIVDSDKSKTKRSKARGAVGTPSKPVDLSDRANTVQSKDSGARGDCTPESKVPKRVTNESVDKSNEDLNLSQSSRPTRHSSKPYYSKSARSRKKIKRRLSAEKRNSLHRPAGTLSPQSNLPGTSGVSPQSVSGSFVASTQNFSPASRQGDGQDPYSFHGSQSQASPTAEEPGGSATVQTPVSTRKRSRLQHKKSGLKKPKLDTENAENNSQNRQHVSFVHSPRMSSQSSDVTVTSIGSLPSIPSSISQSSPGREAIVSPTSSSSRHSVSEEISTRLSGKRMSIEQALPDTLPLTHSEEDNYQRVTVVIEKVERVFREITTTRKVIGSQGQVLENTQDVKRLDPVIVEENTHKKVQYVYIPSPSRSVSSLTSGDLADVSSSLSRSSVSSGSLGSKVGSLSSSLDRNPSVTKHLETQTSLDQSQADQSHGEALKSIDDNAEKSSSGELMAAPSSVPRSKQPRLSIEGQSSTSERIKPKQPLEKQTNKISALKQTTPEAPTTGSQKGVTPGPSSERGQQSKPSTPAIHSDQEISDVQTPLGSTINKSSSYLHSRTSSVESPKVSDSLFSTSSDDNKKPAPNKGKQTNEESSTDASAKENQSSDQVSSEIPYQDQHVSSSQSATSEEQVAMVTSNGSIGSRVMAKWKDGFFYPGCLKSSPDRNAKQLVHFDDGSKLSVKAGDILLIERLPLGQSVMVLTDEGDFESGLITKAEEDNYTVETDEGTSGRYTFSQVILSSDQAECIMSDQGQDVIVLHRTPIYASSNNGNVSLENLLDGPRRSATKKSAATAEVKNEDEDQGQSGKGRKRKHDILKPQATSTPTPKGKSESALAKRRKMLTDSPVAGIQSSPVPVTRKTRKTRVDLFGKGLGPIPGKKIFRNINFLLTNVEKSKELQEEEKKLIQGSSLDTSTDESAAEEDAGVLFDKEHLRRQIEAGGGVVLDSLNENQVSTGKRKIVLLSSTYQRTIKYLQCLASGIPCLSHMWVVDSCTQERLLDDKSYVLPAGISLEKKKVMEWRKKNTVFQGIKAAVYSKNKKFVDSWTQILSLAGCEVHKQLQNNDIHVIVTDNSCTATVERGAESNCVPLVGTEWVIQCLVNARLVSYKGHPRYKHDCWT